MSAALSRIRPIPRRGLTRDEAAMYCGISAAEFDKLRKAGKMPAPIPIGSVSRYDIFDLDVAFNALKEAPISDHNEWDEAV